MHCCKRASDYLPVRMLGFVACVLFLSITSWAGAAEETVEDAPVVLTPDEKAAIANELIRDGKLDIDAAVKHFENLYRADSSIATTVLTITKPRRERSMEMKVWTRGEDKALIVIQSPPRMKGTATLKVDDNLWNYMPRIKRTLRIAPSMMLSPWMGSDFTNDDLVRESSFEEDYTYELVGRSEDPAGWLVRFNARPDLVGLWKRFELVVSEDGTLPLQARYYDRKGRHSRTIHWDEVKVFDGKKIPARMLLVPENEEGRKTEMRYLDIKFNVKVPESTFSLSQLEKTR